jgi:hypothetical protein
VGPEDDQDDDKHDDHVRNAQHCAWGPSNRPVGIIERVPGSVKPDFGPRMVY